MLSVAPLSVMLIGVFGMLVIAFAVTRMTILERQVRRPGWAQLPEIDRSFVDSRA